MRLGIVTPATAGREAYLTLATRSIGDPRIPHVIVEGTDTSAIKLNRGIIRLKDLGCTHYMFLADDDVLVPGWYGAHYQGYMECPDADFVYGDILTISESGQPTGFWIPPLYTEESLLSKPTLPGVGFIRMEVWDRAGGYPDVPFGADWLMFAKALPLKVKRIEGAWYGHRQWPNTESVQADRAPLFAELARIRESR